MASSSALSGGDLFLGRKGKLSRARGRGKARSERWNFPVPASERQEAEAARIVEHRQKVIRVTLANQGFESVFQPIVELGSGGVVGAEALTRFEMTPIRSPDVWFAEAREVGLGVELEMAALRSSLSQLSRLPSGLYLSLNASPDTMMSPEFRDALADAPAERVVLELTEHESVDDYELLETTVNRLRSDGVRLAVDDAGAGFSSFRHILKLRPDIIKLDVALTRGIDGDPARSGPRIGHADLRARCVQRRHRGGRHRDRGRVQDASWPWMSLRTGLLPRPPGPAARPEPATGERRATVDRGGRCGTAGPVAPGRRGGAGPGAGSRSQGCSSLSVTIWKGRISSVT